MFYSPSTNFADWFEMKDIRTKKYDEAVWIPLLSEETEKKGELCKVGSEQVEFYSQSILVPNDAFNVVEKIKWSDLSDCNIAVADVNEIGKYKACDVINRYISQENMDEKNSEVIPINAIIPVLTQQFGSGETDIWHLHQDIVLALKLLRCDDSWVRPDENYVEVAHLIRKDGNPVKLEIKNEFLKDYLCARQMGLYVATVDIREKYFGKDPCLGWKEGLTQKELNNGEWWGTYNKTTDSGYSVGETALIVNATRTDDAFNEDVPTIDYTDHIKVETKDVNLASENEVFMYLAELYKYELILPGSESVRIRGDEPSNLPFFKINASGKSVASNQLKDGKRWLWFNPDVVNRICSMNKPSLIWESRDVGIVGCGRFKTPFGVNKKGLVSVYAKDIAVLPVWMQEIWAGYNIPPEGGVSKELLIMQAMGLPVRSQAPEKFLPKEYKRLNESFEKKYGIPLFNITPEVDVLLTKANRFQSFTQAGFFELAKDLAKLTCDSINKKALLKLLIGVEDKNLGSLKVLENILIQKESIAEDQAKSIMAPFFGINDLRQTDAHIKGPDTETAMQAVGIKKDLIPLFRGTDMLYQFVNTIVTINGIITNEKETGKIPVS